MDIQEVLKLLRPKQKSMLGIDISSSAVKMLEISHAGEVPCVEGYGREILPPGSVEGTTIKDIDAVAQCIRNLVAKAKFTSKQVAVAVPDSSVIGKVVQLNDGLSEQEMEELVAMEADKYIPYPIDEVNLDFQVTGVSAKNAAMLDVLIVASRSENINSRTAAISQAGLETKFVDVESYAVERAAQLLAAQLPGEGKIVAVIDIGANYTHIFVLHGMQLIFSREEKFGGMQLIDSIAQHYKMPVQKAIADYEANKLPEDFEALLLEPFKEKVLIQIKRALQFFYSTSQHGFVDQILLAGGLASLSGLTGIIQEQSGTATKIANPLSQMTFGSKVDVEAITKEAPALMVACGLALRKIR